MVSNMVISYKTAKEIWDALKTQCQGTMAIKKNKIVVLVQEYEQYDAKADESITDIYDRFLTLLNDLSLVAKEYDRGDSNTKFLRAFPEDWDTQASIIRHHDDLDLQTLDEVYGMLKTHDLEIQQRKNKKGQKIKVVALTADTNKGKEKISERSRRRNIMEESDTDESSDSDTDEDSEIELDDPQVVEMAVMLVKGFRKMRFEKPQRKGGFNRKFSGDGKGTDNDDECYALMERMLQELISLIVDNKKLREINDFLDAKLVCMYENEKTCKMAQHNETQINIKYARLEKVLEKEREVFKTWMTSGRKVHSFVSDKNWKECIGYNKFTDRNINKAINNTTLVKFVRIDENGVKSVYEVGSTSKNPDKKKAEPRVSDKKKEEPKIKEKRRKNIGLLYKIQLDEKICEVTARTPHLGLRDVEMINKGKKKNVIVLDSGCSEHMTGTKSMLSENEEKAGPMVSCVDGNIGKPLGYGNIIIGNFIISNVVMVDGLKHNLLSISQITEIGFYVVFNDTHYEVVHKITKKIMFKAYGHGNIYEAKLYANTNGPETCLVTKASMQQWCLFPISDPVDGKLYFDPFGLRVQISSQVYRPSDFPQSVFDHLSWDDQLELQFFTMETHFEEHFRVEEAEQRRRATLEL
ncbi:uncharacterized protein LOC141680083 [Apium graveolens]|uniref:uncharacterized protein LOC141680083 n=1 Tax=Apium graveolens TaxID=4045 RepID=UPI003D79626F